jgi:hypothetical protein
MDNIEIWKDIPNYEGYYQASNSGNIRGVDRVIVNSLGRTKTINGETIKPTIGKDGYLKLNLGKGGKKATFRVHRLVMMAFHGYSDLVVDHINNNILDNRLQNLRYCTVRENVSFESPNKQKTSKYTGVYKLREGVWGGTIYLNKISYFLGSSEYEEEILRLYDKSLYTYELYGVPPERKSDIEKPKCCKISHCDREGEKHRLGHTYFPRGYCRYHYRKRLKDNKKVKI